jgi:hypothetical protein
MWGDAAQPAFTSLLMQTRQDMDGRPPAMSEQTLRELVFDV